MRDQYGFRPTGSTEKNKLRINITKTKEIVFWRTKQASKKHNIPMIQNIERVEHAKLLGVHFVSDMTWSIHLDHVLSKVSQSFYLLNQLKQMKLNISGLNTVYRAISLSQIEYALPVFSGALRQSDIERINSTVRKARRRGLTNLDINFGNMSERMDRDLFRKTLEHEHCLNQLLPLRKDNQHNLRITTVSKYNIQKINNEKLRKSFIIRNCIKE